MVNFVSDRDFFLIALACLIVFPIISFIYMKIKYPKEDKGFYWKKEKIVILTVVFILVIATAGRYIMKT